MIDFQIYESRKYFLSWDEEYEYLYFSIHPITPIKSFTVDGILHLEQDVGAAPFKVLKNRLRNPLDLPVRLQNATYSFELYREGDGKGEPLLRREQYFGIREYLETYLEPSEKGFIKWKAVCNYKIPRELFWFSIKGPKAEDRRGQFFLPVMEKRENSFETSCILKKEAYDRLEICLDGRISDCVSVR